MNSSMCLLSRALIIFSSFFAAIYGAQETVVLNFDSLYPKTDYSHVEQVMKELWSDLDLLIRNHDLHDRFLYESDYLLDQYIALEKQLERMAARNEGFSAYLLEDIEYLAGIVGHLEEKSCYICQTLTGSRAADIEFSVSLLLGRCRDHVSKLYEQNYEVEEI